MRKLSQRATKTFCKLIEGLQSVGDHWTIDSGNGYMAVHVEIIAEDKHGKQVSIAHYYKQNGDMMKDPDMVFLVAKEDQAVYPLTFQQDNMGIYHEAVVLGEQIKLRPKMQADITVFANTWMQNINEQQF